MSALVIGDQHFSLSNYSTCELFIEKVCDTIKKREPSFCVLLGDLLHTHERLHTCCKNLAEKFIEKVSDLVETYVLVGNHDMISNTQFLNDNHWLNPMKKWK